MVEDKFTEEINNQLKKIESRVFDLRIRYNNSYITFTGFILTISGVFLGFKQDLTVFTKYSFLLTIILLIIGIFLYLESSKYEIKKVEEIYTILSKVESTVESINKIKEDLDKNNNRNKIEKIIGKLYMIFEYSGSILFIIGIISFMFSGK